MPTAKLFFDSVGHKDENGDRHYADGKGELVELTDEEYERLSELGAVGGENDPVPSDGPSPFEIPVGTGGTRDLAAEAAEAGQVLMSREQYEELVAGAQVDAGATAGGDLSDDEKAVYSSGTAAELESRAEGLGITVETGDSKKDVARKIAAAEASIG